MKGLNGHRVLPSLFGPVGDVARFNNDWDAAWTAFQECAAGCKEVGDE